MNSREKLRRLLGRPIKDVYGRPVGSVAAVTFDKAGKITTVAIEHSDGTFSPYDLDHILIQGDEVILIPVWKAKAQKLDAAIRAAQSKLTALDQLVQSGRISQITYEELRKSYARAMEELEEKRKELVATLKGRVSQLRTEAHELEKFLARIEVDHMTGDIDEESYKLLGNSLRATLARLVSEIKDIEEILAKLSAT